MNAASDYFSNKVAVVTGGASGIGLALAEMMLGYGAKQVVLADFNDEKLEREAARLNTAYARKIAGVHCNVTKEKDVQSMIRQAAAIDGRIDLLFNNAGAGFGGYFDKLTDEDWEKAFALNFYGALYGIRAVLPIMRQQGDGHIINIVSGIAFAPMAQQTMYVATKAALNGLTLALRYALGRAHSSDVGDAGHDGHRDLGRRTAASRRAVGGTVGADDSCRRGAERAARPWRRR